MSALSTNDPGDPRSHRYYAPRQRRVVAREATLQPVLERLRGSTREYSEDERLNGGVDPVPFPEPDVVLVPDQRFPFAALAAFAGGAAAVAAVAVAYIVFGTNGVPPVAAAAPTAPPAAHAPAARIAAAPGSRLTQTPVEPPKIDARVSPNQPVSPPRIVQAQVASADATGAVPVDTAKGDRLDASANPTPGAAYDPLQSPLSLWSLSPTQTAIEGADPALAAPGAPPPAESIAAAAPPPAAEHHAEHHASPARHRARHHHYVRHVHHRRHHKPAAAGEAQSGANAQNAGDANGAAASGQTDSPKKFLGLFGG